MTTRIKHMSRSSAATRWYIARLLSCLALLLSAQFVFAKPPTVVSLSHAGKWEVNYDKDACHLLARFGVDPGAIVLRMTRFEPGDAFDLVLYGTPLKSRTRDVKFTFDFGLSNGPIERDALSGSMGKFPMLLAGSMRLDGAETVNGQTLPLITTAQEAAAKSMTVGLRGKLYRLETGRLDRPLAELRKCQENLLKHWGFDPVVQASLTRRAQPIGNIGSWARPSDFPLAPLSEGKSGRVKVRLDVAADGSVTACHVLEQTNPSAFAKATCGALQKRGRFEPALTAAGEAVASFWVSSVVWLS